MTDQPEQVPTVSRDVHFLDYKGRHLAAKISEEGTPETGQTLHVCEIDQGQQPVSVKRNVMQDATQSRTDTWHWPERR